ncbi:hypothetical protein WJX74_005901 [Apatococcus lobatus]|uniref:Uncharacterized protein n=1 Tax=Apatococcus lobatus TaxID=904363 RepID=A0AAW1SFD4_9CHLO
MQSSGTGCLDIIELLTTPARVSQPNTVWTTRPHKLKCESCVTLKLADEGLVGVVVKVTFADADGTPQRAVLQHAPGLSKPFQQLGELCFAELVPAARPSEPQRRKSHTGRDPGRTKHVVRLGGIRVHRYLRILFQGTLLPIAPGINGGSTGAHRIAKLLVHAPICMVPETVLAAHRSQAQLARAPQPTLFTPTEILCKPQAGLTPRPQQETRHRQPWRPSSTSVTVPQASSSQAPSRRQSLGVQLSSSAASGCAAAASHNASRRSSLGTVHAANSHAAVLNAKLATGQPLHLHEPSRGQQLTGQDALLGPGAGSHQKSSPHGSTGMRKPARSKPVPDSQASNSQESSSLIPAYRPAVAVPRELNAAAKGPMMHRGQPADLLPHHARPRSDGVAKAGHFEAVPTQSGVFNTGNTTLKAAGREGNLEQRSKRHLLDAVGNTFGPSAAQVPHDRSSRLVSANKPRMSDAVSEEPQQLRITATGQGLDEDQLTLQGNQHGKGMQMTSSPQRRHHPQLEKPATSSCKQVSRHDGMRASAQESMGESRSAASVHGNANGRNVAGRSSYAARWMSSLDAAMRSLDIAADRTSHALQSRLAPTAKPCHNQQASAGSGHAHSSAKAASSVASAQKGNGHPQNHATFGIGASTPAALPASSATCQSQHDPRVVPTSEGAAASSCSAASHGPEPFASQPAQQQQPSACNHNGKRSCKAASGSTPGQGSGSVHCKKGIENRHYGYAPYVGDGQPTLDVQGCDMRQTVPTDGKSKLPAESRLLDGPPTRNALDSLQDQAASRMRQAALQGTPPQPLHRLPAGAVPYHSDHSANVRLGSIESQARPVADFAEDGPMQHQPPVSKLAMSPVQDLQSLFAAGSPCTPSAIKRAQQGLPRMSRESPQSGTNPWWSNPLSKSNRALPGQTPPHHDPHLQEFQSPADGTCPGPTPLSRSSVPLCSTPPESSGKGTHMHHVRANPPLQLQQPAAGMGAHPRSQAGKGPKAWECMVIPGKAPGPDRPLVGLGSPVRMAEASHAFLAAWQSPCRGQPTSAPQPTSPGTAGGTHHPVSSPRQPLSGKMTNRAGLFPNEAVQSCKGTDKATAAAAAARAPILVGNGACSWVQPGMAFAAGETGCSDAELSQKVPGGMSLLSQSTPEPLKSGVSRAALRYANLDTLPDADFDCPASAGDDDHGAPKAGGLPAASHPEGFQPNKSGPKPPHPASVHADACSATTPQPHLAQAGSSMHQHHQQRPAPGSAIEPASPSIHPGFRMSVPPATPASISPILERAAGRLTPGSARALERMRALHMQRKSGMGTPLSGHTPTRKDVSVAFEAAAAGLRPSRLGRRAPLEPAELTEDGEDSDERNIPGGQVLAHRPQQPQLSHAALKQQLAGAQTTACRTHEVMGQQHCQTSHSAAGQQHLPAELSPGRCGNAQEQPAAVNGALRPQAPTAHVAERLRDSEAQSHGSSKRDPDPAGLSTPQKQKRARSGRSPHLPPQHPPGDAWQDQENIPENVSPPRSRDTSAKSSPTKVGRERPALKAAQRFPAPSAALLSNPSDSHAAADTHVHVEMGSDSNQQADGDQRFSPEGDGAQAAAHRSMQPHLQEPTGRHHPPAEGPLADELLDVTEQARTDMPAEGSNDDANLQQSSVSGLDGQQKDAQSDKQAVQEARDYGGQNQRLKGTPALWHSILLRQGLALPEAEQDSPMLHRPLAAGVLHAQQAAYGTSPHRLRAITSPAQVERLLNSRPPSLHASADSETSCSYTPDMSLRERYGQPPEKVWPPLGQLSRALAASAAEALERVERAVRPGSVQRSALRKGAAARAGPLASSCPAWLTPSHQVSGQKLPMPSPATSPPASSNKARRKASGLPPRPPSSPHKAISFSPEPAPGQSHPSEHQQRFSTTQPSASPRQPSRLSPARSKQILNGRPAIKPAQASAALTGDWRTVSTEIEHVPLPQRAEQVPSFQTAEAHCQPATISQNCQAQEEGCILPQIQQFPSAIETQTWDQQVPHVGSGTAAGMHDGQEAQLASMHGGRPVRRTGLRASWEARHPRMSAWTRRKQADALEQGASGPVPDPQQDRCGQLQPGVHVHGKSGMDTQKGAGNRRHDARVSTRTVSSFGAMASDVAVEDKGGAKNGFASQGYHTKRSHAPAAAAWAMTKRLWRR